MNHPISFMCMCTYITEASINTFVCSKDDIAASTGELEKCDVLM
jgi:hypothetical protein